MAKKIVWAGRDKTGLRAIDRETAIVLLHGPARFISTRGGDVKDLQGIDLLELRLRLGDYFFGDLGGSLAIPHVPHHAQVGPHPRHLHRPVRLRPYRIQRRLRPRPQPNGWAIGRRRFTTNGKCFGSGDPIRVRERQRVLCHILDASSTANI